MEKSEIIKCIKNILKDFGCFNIGELEGENQSILVGELGNYVGLIEAFYVNHVEVSVYEPQSMSSDAIDDYKINYEDLEDDILSDVLLLCEQWEAENIRTQKRISN